MEKPCPRSRSRCTTDIALQGIGAALVRAFEARARQHGCSSFYLATFSFQAPESYRSLGYAVAHEPKVYPHGIVKVVLVKQEPARQNAG